MHIEDYELEYRDLKTKYEYLYTSYLGLNNRLVELERRFVSQQLLNNKELRKRVERWITSGLNAVESIKRIREQEQCGLKEAHDYFRQVQKELRYEQEIEETYRQENKDEGVLQ